MNKNNKLSKIIMALTAFVQSQLIFIFSAAICIGGAKLLITKLGFPEITMVIGIILGVLSGLFGMFKYIMQTLNAIDKKNSKKDKG